MHASTRAPRLLPSVRRAQVAARTRAGRVTTGRIANQVPRARVAPKNIQKMEVSDTSMESIGCAMLQHGARPPTRNEQQKRVTQRGHDPTKKQQHKTRRRCSPPPISRAYVTSSRQRGSDACQDCQASPAIAFRCSAEATRINVLMTG